MAGSSGSRRADVRGQPTADPSGRALSRTRVSVLCVGTLITTVAGCDGMDTASRAGVGASGLPLTPAGAFASGLARPSPDAGDCAGPGGAELPRYWLAIETGREDVPGVVVRFPMGYQARRRSIPDLLEPDSNRLFAELGMWGTGGGAQPDRWIELGLSTSEGYPTIGGLRQVRLVECRDSAGPGILRAAVIVASDSAGLDRYFFSSYRDLIPGVWLQMFGEALAEDELRLQLDAARSVRLP